MSEEGAALDKAAPAAVIHGGRGAAAFARAVAQARESAPRAVQALLDTISSPDRHSAAVVSAAKVLLELAARDDAPDGPGASTAKVIVVTQNDFQAELARRGLGSAKLVSGPAREEADG